MTRGIRQLCGIIGLFFLISLMDGFVSGYLEPKGICRVFSGHSEVMSGRLPMRIPDVSSLAFTSQSPLITVQFIEVEGNMWRGSVQASEEIEQGEYTLNVHLKGQIPDEKGSAERVLIFQGESAYRASFHSLFRKTLGISPWWVTALSLPLLLLSFALSYGFSLREEALLNGIGLASIFKVTRKNSTCQVSFASGHGSGLRVGDSVLILDKNRRMIGEGSVKGIANDLAVAVVDPDLGVEPDFLVDMRRTCECPSMGRQGMGHPGCSAMG